MARAVSERVVVSFPASADLSAYLYHIVYINSSGEVALAATKATQSFGVLQNKPTAAGQPAEVCVLGGTKLRAGDTLSAGGIFMADTATGHAMACTPADATAYILGRVLEDAVDGQIVSAVVNCVCPMRAA